MSEAPINLNKVRKARNRNDTGKTADANAQKHGRTKAARVLEAARNDKARAMLDQHHMDDDV